jgi:hypothetical protein
MDFLHSRKSPAVNCRAFSLYLGALESDPHAVAPIAMALVRFAPMVLAITIPMSVEIPVIGMIFEGETGHRYMRFGVPAVAFVVARNIGL